MSTEAILLYYNYNYNYCRLMFQVSKNEIKIPWGSGIVGFVAKTGESCNVTDCYKDARSVNGLSLSLSRSPSLSGSGFNQSEIKVNLDEPRKGGEGSIRLRTRNSGRNAASYLNYFNLQV